MFREKNQYKMTALLPKKDEIFLAAAVDGSYV
jgi:hypothetical protein